MIPTVLYRWTEAIIALLLVVVWTVVSYILRVRINGSSGIVGLHPLFNSNNMLWTLINRSQLASRVIGRLIILNAGTSNVFQRPHKYGLNTPYISWENMEATYFSRLIPSLHPKRKLTGAQPEIVANLFVRTDFAQEVERHSNMLLVLFSQWLVESLFQMTSNFSDKELKKTGGRHVIDLECIYGDTKLKQMSLRTGEGGKLKSQTLNSEEFPPYQEDTGSENSVHLPNSKHLFLLGIPKSNAQIGSFVFNTILLREHNRICDSLKTYEPTADDEFLFQKARLILTAMILKVIVEDFLAHIFPMNFALRFSPTLLHYAPFVKDWQYWNQLPYELKIAQNWYSMSPERVTLSGEEVATQDLNADTVVNNGLERFVKDMVKQPAGRVGVHNTPAFLLDLEVNAVEQTRALETMPYNEYRKAFNLPPATKFEDVSGNNIVCQQLTRLYGSPDRLEFYAGLYAEDTVDGCMLPPLMSEIVFSGLLTAVYSNPLCSPQLWNEETFTRLGWNMIETTSLAGIMTRNVSKAIGPKVSFRVNSNIDA